MSITSTIQTAYSGLRVSQAAMEVVSSNVSNAQTAGYTKRRLNQTEALAGTQSTGVASAGAQRVLDTLLQRQLRLETAGAAYTSTKSATTTQLDALIDPTSGTGAINTALSSFTASLQALGTDPTSSPARSAVLAAASTVAARLNDLSAGVQSLRQSAEDGLSADVSSANTLLSQISTINRTITSDPANATNAALLDQRDGYIDQLSKLMDVKVTSSSNGSVSLATTGGLTLFDGQNAVKLSFDARSPVTASSAYSTDPAKRGVGTITATDQAGNKTDVIATGSIRSGEIAAYVELRDETLPQAQTQLDQIAAGMSAAMSDKTVQGATTTSGASSSSTIDISGLKSGNAITLAVNTSAGAKTYKFVRVDSTSSLPLPANDGTGATVVGIDFSGGTASVASQIGAALGPGFTASGSGTALTIADDGAAGTTDVTAMSANATVTTLAGGDPQLALFVDGNGNTPYTGSVDGANQITGFASRIKVNPGVSSNPAALVSYGPSVASGDTARPDLLYGALTGTNRVFSGSAGIGGSTAPFTGTVADFANQVIATQASNATAASTLNDGQQVALNAIQSRFSDTSGVNIDEEMTQLIQLQTAYSANARVMTAAKDMMDLLLRVGS